MTHISLTRCFASFFGFFQKVMEVSLGVSVYLGEKTFQSNDEKFRWCIHDEKLGLPKRCYPKTPYNSKNVFPCTVFVNFKNNCVTFDTAIIKQQ